MRGYVKMASLIDEQSFSATELCEQKNNLLGAMASFEQLERILQKIDNRSNEIGIVLFNCFGLLDITIVRHFFALATYLRTNYRPMDYCIKHIRCTCFDGYFPPQ